MVKLVKMGNTKQYRGFHAYLILVVIFYLQSSIVAEPLKCSKSHLEYAPGKWEQLCVFRGVIWRKGTPEPEFQESMESLVAFMDSKLSSIPNGFYDKFPQLKLLVANDLSLQKLVIKNNAKVVYAERNEIERVEIENDHHITDLYLRSNPISNIGNITSLGGLEVLDVSNTNIVDSHEQIIDFKTFVRLNNLTELYLSNLDAHYIENVDKVTLPELKKLDLSGNPIIPSNFQLEAFALLPKLEELSLRDAMMADINVGSNIRRYLPALQRIDIDGNNWKCSLLTYLLELLKESNIEVIGVTSPNSKKCPLGFESVSSLCCQSSGNFWPTQTPPTENKKNETENTPVTTERHQTPEVTPTSDSNSKSAEDGGSSTVIIVSVIVVIAVLAVAAFVGIFLKRRSQGNHKAVPRNDPSDNL